MKIALFFDLPSGGAKRTVYEQVKRLSARHQLDLFTLSTANQDFADVRPFVRHVQVAAFDPLPLARSPLGRLNAAIRVIDILRLRRVMRSLALAINAGRYDVALIHPCQTTFSPSILRFLAVPSLYYRHDLVRWLHDWPVERPYDRHTSWCDGLNAVDPLRATYRWLLLSEDRVSMQAATRVVTNSCFMRESLYRIYGVAPHLCYHGVDVSLFRPLQQERRGFVLSVGMLVPAKGYDFVIQSLACIPVRQRPPLIIVSNTSQEQEALYLQQIAERLVVQVTFKSMVSDEELVDLYNQAACTVYAPVMESFGLVPLESMACGTPVVGIREGGVRETVVHEQTGLLADRDPEQFASAICRLLDNPGLCEKMGKQARTYVERYWTWEQAVARLEVYLQGTARCPKRE